HGSTNCSSGPAIESLGASRSEGFLPQGVLVVRARALPPDLAPNAFRMLRNWFWTSLAVELRGAAEASYQLRRDGTQRVEYSRLPHRSQIGSRLLRRHGQSP